MTVVIDLVAGARPNFVKLAPVLRALDREGRLHTRVVHTGQHYDFNMNEVFFQQLGIRNPDVHLGVGAGTQGAQTARILERYEAHLVDRRPGGTVVFGDVNSTVACALAAVKLGVPVAHVEAGLRSFDRSMPEEINRVLTDAISDLLLVSEPSGVENLRSEGISGRRVELVGNVMIDTLMSELEVVPRDGLEAFGLTEGGYALLTMHRPSNVDHPEVLAGLVELLVELSGEILLVFAVHPRTRRALEQSRLWDRLAGVEGIRLLEPCPYRDMLLLMRSARLLLTDSGGMQEETAVLGTPCLTMRDNTERPVTLELGTSELVGNDPERIRDAFARVMSGGCKTGQNIPMWDGRSGERVARALERWMTDGGTGA